jgi:hypothetical protein
MVTDSFAVTDWLEITITFKAKCNECGKDVLPGKALWSRSAKAARHLSCDKKIGNQVKTSSLMAQNIMEPASELIKRDSAITELKCFICGLPKPHLNSPLPPPPAPR